MPKPPNARAQVRNSAASALQIKFNQAVALHQQGSLKEAERIYAEVLLQQPRHFDTLHLLGVIAIQTGRTEQGIELIRKAIELNAKLASAHSNLANALMILNRPEEALASYGTAIALHPSYAEAHNNRGNALLALMRPEEALASYDRAIMLKQDYAEAYSNRGSALGDLKRPEEALESYDRAIWPVPGSEDTELGVLMELEVGHGETEVYTRVQA